MGWGWGRGEHSGGVKLLVEAPITSWVIFLTSNRKSNSILANKVIYDCKKKSRGGNFRSGSTLPGHRVSLCDWLVFSL